MQRYELFQYQANFSATFFDKKERFSGLFTKRDSIYINYINIEETFFSKSTVRTLWVCWLLASDKNTIELDKKGGNDITIGTETNHALPLRSYTYRARVYIARIEVLQVLPSVPTN